jgi:RimJ/RimL family protein N-acetyltransferase
MKQAQKIIGRRMMLLAAKPEHAAFILQLRQQERKSRYLSGQVPSVAEQIAWMQKREKLPDDAYFVIFEVDKPDTPLGTIRLHDAIHEKNSIRVSSWVMVDGVAPKKTLEALALAIEYITQTQYTHCHFEVHQHSRSALDLYTKLGTQITGATQNTFLLSCPPLLFLHNMQCVYHQPLPAITGIEMP